MTDIKPGHPVTDTVPDSPGIEEFPPHVLGEYALLAGAYPLLDVAPGFVAERMPADGPGLKPAYTVAGGPVPAERDLDLPGYPGGSDKVGNRVNQQFQLDAFGETLLLAADADRNRLDSGHWQAVQAAVAAIGERGRDPDDIAQRQMRGNLPQAFVHALVLESAARLAEPWPR